MRLLFTPKECEEWRVQPFRNPKTGRLIKKTKKNKGMYATLEKQCGQPQSQNSPQKAEKHKKRVVFDHVASPMQELKKQDIKSLDDVGRRHRIFFHKTFILDELKALHREVFVYLDFLRSKHIDKVRTNKWITMFLTCDKLRLREIMITHLTKRLRVVHRHIIKLHRFYKSTHGNYKETVQKDHDLLIYTNDKNMSGRGSSVKDDHFLFALQNVQEACAFSEAIDVSEDSGNYHVKIHTPEFMLDSGKKRQPACEIIADPLQVITDQIAHDIKIIVTDQQRLRSLNFDHL